MAKELKCAALMKDNGDGGYSIKIYNDTAELIADHYGVKSGDVTAEDVLSEDDPYQNGYVNLNITITLTDDGLRLASPIRLHVGQ